MGPSSGRHDGDGNDDHGLAFVLVHGAWHGAWCWDPLVGALRQAGARPTAIDLPGHGGDLTPLDQLSLSDYAESVADSLRAADQPVVLVGHSLGGMVVSEAAERVPEKVSMLVYLCAFMLSDGQSALDGMGSDLDSELIGSLVPSADGLSTMVDPDAAGALFYADCPPDVQRWAATRLTPEPIGPPTTNIRLTPERWGSIPRAYIVCTHDRAISPAHQQAMIDHLGVDVVHHLETSHSPFLSRPDELAALLLHVAATTPEGGRQPG